MKKILVSVCALAFVLSGCHHKKKAPAAVITPVIVDDKLSTGSIEYFKNNVGDRVFFGFDKSSLSGEAKAQLDRIVEWMAEHSYEVIEIEGHCDERGTREYNYGLGEKRANAVKVYLVNKGINPANITVTSYGKDKPAVIATTEEEHAINRRAVVILAK